MWETFQVLKKFLFNIFKTCWLHLIQNFVYIFFIHLVNVYFFLSQHFPNFLISPYQTFGTFPWSCPPSLVLNCWQIYINLSKQYLSSQESLTPSSFYRWHTSHRFRHKHCTWEYIVDNNNLRLWLCWICEPPLLFSGLTSQCSLLGLFYSFWWLVTKGLPCGWRQNTKWSWRSLLCLYAEDLDNRNCWGLKVNK